MISYKHKVGDDIKTIKKNFQAYKPFISPISKQMFWVSIAITVSYLISQVYLALTK